MSGQVGIFLDQKSDAKVMPKIRRHAKTDVRFWKETIFRRKRGAEEDQNWTAQIQYLKRREQFPLDTPNKDAAAAKARDIYLSLHARGWEETLAIYKPQPEPVEVKPEHSTVGDLIRDQFRQAPTTASRLFTILRIGIILACLLLIFNAFNQLKISAIKRSHFTLTLKSRN